MRAAARSPALWISPISRRDGSVSPRRSQEHVAVSVDDREQVVEVVGDPAREPADRLHLLRLAQLHLALPQGGLRLLPRRDVVPDRFHHPAVRRGEGVDLVPPHVGRQLLPGELPDHLPGLPFEFFHGTDEKRRDGDPEEQDAGEDQRSPFSPVSTGSGGASCRTIPMSVSMMRQNVSSTTFRGVYWTALYPSRSMRKIGYVRRRTSRMIEGS